MRLTALVAIALFAAVLTNPLPAAAGSPVVCIAASDPADAGKPIQDIESLEFYADEGNPLHSYSVPFKRVQSEVDGQGRTRNAYRVDNAPAVGATIVFSGSTPLSFAVAELARTYTSLQKSDEDTEFMADAVPGIACYTVSTDLF